MNINTEITNFILLSTNFSNKKCSFLIDTGSDITLIKQSCLDNLDQINSSHSCKISGVTSKNTKSLGLIHGKFFFDNSEVIQDIHVVDDTFNIQTDGILGRDFFFITNSKIDYEDLTITLHFTNYEYKIPLQTKFNDKVSKVFVPPRSEIIHTVNKLVSEDTIVTNQQLSNSIFVSSSLIRKNSLIHCKILNTSDKPLYIHNFEPVLEPLSNYNIMKSHNSEQINDPFSKQRVGKLFSLLNINNLDGNSRDSITNICSQFADIFHLPNMPNEKLSCNNFYSQNIPLTNNRPVYIKNYRQPQTQLEEINKQVHDLLENDVVEPCISAYNAPLLLVKKKCTSQGEKQWRLVVDFRQLNKSIEDDRFPLPRLDDVLDRLGRAKFFTTLDLTSSFHQIAIEPSSRHFTSFSTSSGQFQFKRLPFGLKISTNSFQRMLSIALTGLDFNAFAYVDDIIIFGCSLQHHNQNLIKVFQRLRRFNLKLNPLKCHFLQNEVNYLGHLITSKGIKADPSKIDTVANFPRPNNADEVKRFIAFANYYRRFIEQFADIVKPMNNLLTKNSKFEWSTECEHSFNILKQKLISAPILRYPDFDKTFIVTTDASNYALGAILSQKEDGNDLPIAYASRSLNKHELNKPVIEKELLGIHWAIQYFRPYLYGRKFIVITDHRPLVSLFSHKNPSPKLTRMRLDLSDYNFEVQFKPGKSNVNADALSRIQIDSEILKKLTPNCNNSNDRSEQINVITRSMSRQNQNAATDNTESASLGPIFIWSAVSKSDIKGTTKLFFDIDQKYNVPEFVCTKKCSTLNIKISPQVVLGHLLRRLIEECKLLGISKISLNDDNEIFKYYDINDFKQLFNLMQQNQRDSKVIIILFKKPIYIVDKNLQIQIIQEYHDSLIGGHTGVNRTKKRINEKYTWKNMKCMIKRHVKDCFLCAKNKVLRHTKEPMKITETPSQSFDIISIDTLGPLRPSNDFRYILSIQCELSKYVIYVPLLNKEAKSIARALLEDVVLKFGSFRILKSDQGTEYLNETLSELCVLLGINQKFSTPYHHQSLGSIERNHRVMREYLLSFSEVDNWSEFLQYFAFAYNTTPHTGTNYSPFELIYGKVVKLPTDLLNCHNIDPIYNLNNYVNELKYKLQFSLQKAKTFLEIAKNKCKHYYDNNKNSIKIKVNDLVMLLVGNKLKTESPYIGPFIIIKVEDENVLIKNVKTNKEQLVHKNRIKKL